MVQVCSGFTDAELHLGHFCARQLFSGPFLGGVTWVFLAVWRSNEDAPEAGGQRFPFVLS